MLKLNASYSKKVPAEAEYSSKSYHAALEIELPDGMTQEQVQGKIRETFELVRSSVESEINSGGFNGGKIVSGEMVNDSDKSELASQRQIKYLSDMAKRKGIRLDEILKDMNVKNIADLSRRQCSFLIDEISEHRQRAA